MKRILFIIILFLSCQVFAQTDTAFWFAPPKLSDSIDSTSIRLVFHSYDQPAFVTIEQPANPIFGLSSFSMGTYGTTVYDLSAPGMVSMIETDPVNTVLDRGFYIHSTAPITCYYQSTSNNRETYTLKGHHALGTEFTVMSPVSRINDSSEHDIGMSLEMIATENNTVVTVTAPHVWEYEWDGMYWIPVDTLVEEVFIGGIAEDSTFQFVLNRGQSYALRTNHFNYDLWGTEIRSTKPIAVNVTADQFKSRTIPPTYNLVGEQLVPNNYWGYRYTTIFANGEHVGYYSVDPDSSPDYIIGTSSNRVTYLRGDSRFGASHEIPRNNQMGYTILPQLDCSGSRQISYRHSDSLELFVHIFIDSNYIDGLRFNGDSTILTHDRFLQAPDSSSLAWCGMQVDQYLSANQTMTITCDSGSFILYVVESDSNRGTSYTCLTDYAPCTYINFDMKSEYCTGDSIVFECDQNNIDSLVVYGPNGLLTTTLPYIIPSADSTWNGQYIIEGYSNNDCIYSMHDTINITVYAPIEDTIYDTVTQDQLPWHRFGLEFFNDIDTVIYRDSPVSACDSVYHYHLRIGRNSLDTIIYYTCPSEMPLRYDSLWIYGDTVCDLHYTGSRGQDSVITFVLHVNEDSDTSIFDTIVDSQLPWSFMGIPFEDSISNYLFTLTNEQGCDSVIHYSLYIYWNGDHCDTTLTYPNFVTPNGDGSNDKFVIGGLIENNCFKYSELSIYDRTGRRVYHKANIANESDWWDPAEDRIPSGTYFYYFKAHGVNIHTQRKGVIEVLHEK